MFAHIVHLENTLIMGKISPLYEFNPQVYHLIRHYNYIITMTKLNKIL